MDEVIHTVDPDAPVKRCPECNTILIWMVVTVENRDGTVDSIREGNYCHVCERHFDVVERKENPT